MMSVLCTPLLFLAGFGCSLEHMLTYFMGEQDYIYYIYLAI